MLATIYHETINQASGTEGGREGRREGGREGGRDRGRARGVSDTRGISLLTLLICR